MLHFYPTPRKQKSLSRRDLIGEFRSVHLLLGMLHGHTHQATLLVQFDQDILGQVSRLCHLPGAERDEERICIREIPNIHSLPRERSIEECIVDRLTIFQ